MRFRTVFGLALLLGAVAMALPIGTIGSVVETDGATVRITASGPMTLGDCNKRCKWTGYWICRTPGNPDFMCVTDGVTCADNYECSVPCESPCN